MEDTQIIELFWERKPEAITETAAKYEHYCTSIAMNILGDLEDAKECVNDTYLNAWNSIPPHRPAMLSTFLGKITRNLSFNRYKHENAKKRGGGQLDAVFEELSECVSGKQDPEKEIEFNELVQVIDDFLGTLSVKHRKIFVCRYFYSDSVSAIAKHFHMKENAVSMTLRRIRIRLHGYLLERGYDV